MVTDPVEGAFRWVENSFVGSPAGSEEWLMSTTLDVDAVLVEDEVTYGDGFDAVSAFH
jgi:hypothetical protein